MMGFCRFGFVCLGYVTTRVTIHLINTVKKKKKGVPVCQIQLIRKVGCPDHVTITVVSMTRRNDSSAYNHKYIHTYKFIVYVRSKISTVHYLIP
jgi:hypothetical protein